MWQAVSDVSKHLPHLHWFIGKWTVIFQPYRSIYEHLITSSGEPKCHPVLASHFYPVPVTRTFDPKNPPSFSCHVWFNRLPWLGGGVCTCQRTLWGCRSSGRRPTSPLKCSFSSSCGNCSTNHNDCWRMWAWLTGSWLPWPRMNFNFLWMRCVLIQVDDRL